LCMYVLNSSKGGPHAANILELQKMQLRGYLRQFAVKPNKDPELWRLARELMADKGISGISLRFKGEQDFREFGQVLLLCGEKQVRWLEVDAPVMVCNASQDIVHTTDYGSYDLVFLVSRPTDGHLHLYSHFSGQMLSLARHPKRVVLCFLGGAADNFCPLPPRTLEDVRNGIKQVERSPKVYINEKRMVGGEIVAPAAPGATVTGGYAV